MQRTTSILAALAAMSTMASAGSIDRHFLDIPFIFESGNAIKFGFFHAVPSLSGRFPAAAGGGTTGDGGDSFENYNASLKVRVNDQISLALLFDQPHGADIEFEGGFYAGLSAEWDTDAITALARYRFANNVSVYAGPRLLRTDASIFVPQSTLAVAGLPASFSANSGTTTDLGFVGGVAYERPEIALRVALTYQSAVDQQVGVAEAFVSPVPLPLPAPGRTQTKVELPQVVQLDFQTGIAPKTLLFGMVRWADWSEFGVRTEQFSAVTGLPVADVLDDIWTLRLGIGRQLTDALSGFLRVTWEPQTNSLLSRVAPTDGRFAVGAGGSYTLGPAKLTTGVEYIDLGGGSDGFASFRNNDVFIVGSSIQFGF